MPIMKTRNHTINKITFIFTLLFFGISFISFNACNQGPPDNSRPAQAQRGKVHFQTYCSACHGDDAKGIMIDTLNALPADLTKILSNRKTSEFPVLEIARIIDGRKLISGHGTRAMPIWGDVFSTQEHLDEKEIKGKLGELIAYLMSIQSS